MIFAMYIKSAKKLQICKKIGFLRFFATPAQGEKIKIFKFLKKIRKLWPKSTPDSYMDDQIYIVDSTLNTSNKYIWSKFWYSHQHISNIRCHNMYLYSFIFYWLHIEPLLLFFSHHILQWEGTLVIKFFSHIFAKELNIL